MGKTRKDATSGLKKQFQEDRDRFELTREPRVEGNAVQATKGKLNMAFPKGALKKPKAKSTKTEGHC